jgi:hypothetical protein
MADFFFDSNEGAGGAFYFASNDANDAVPVIDAISSPNPLHGSSLVITVRNASASGNTVTLGGVAQTITAEDTDEITITVSRGTNKYGVPLDLVVTDALSAVGSPHVVSSIQPPAGWAYVNLTSLVTAGLRITAIADLASGNQLAYETIGGDVTVFADGHVEIAAGFVSPVEFDVEAWVIGDGWGDVGTQEFIDVGSLAGVTFPIDSEGSLPLVGASIDWFISVTWGGEMLDEGTSITNESGNLVLTLLTAGAGVRWLHYKLSTDDNFAAARKVTLA